MGDIGNKISEANNRPEATTSTPSSDSANILAKLNDTEVKLASQADRLETGINAMSLKLKEEIVHHGEKLHNLFSEVRIADRKLRMIIISLIDHNFLGL